MTHSIISTKKYVHEGNDCLIKECASLIEVPEEDYYIVLYTKIVTGWSYYEDTTTHVFNNRNEAGKYFKNIFN